MVGEITERMLHDQPHRNSQPHRLQKMNSCKVSYSVFSYLLRPKAQGSF